MSAKMQRKPRPPAGKWSPQATGAFHPRRPSWVMWRPLPSAFTELAQAGFTDILIRNLVSDQDKALASIARLAAVKD